MWSKNILTSFCLAAGFSALTLVPTTVSAQDSTSGAISGTVKDKATGESLAGVTVYITSLSQKNSYNAITNESGYFKVSSLPPGDYSVLYIYLNIKTKQPSVHVSIGKSSQQYAKIDLTQTSGATYITKGRPTIDTTKTTQGVVIDKLFTESLPIPGGTFESSLSIASGAQDDGVGISFSGSSSLENQYVVDGVNTTGLGYGTVGSPVINEFIEETEIITGGYMAEHGRSTGGVVNVVTQSGTNDFHGVVFGTFTNSWFQIENDSTPFQSWIDVESNLAYDLSVGATLGGPIIKDKLWFFVGIVPRVIARDNIKITKRRTDCREILDDGTESKCDPTQFADGEPDENDVGDFIYEELDRKKLRSQATVYNFVAKINYSPSPEHAGQMTIGGTPSNQQSIGFLGEPQAVSRDQQTVTTDLSVKWTSKFNDAKTTVEAVLGVHRNSFASSSISEEANNVAQEHLVLGNFGTWAAGSNRLNPSEVRESKKTIDGCKDSMDPNLDPYDLIPNCPDTGVGYRVGGAGFLSDQIEQRTSGKLALLQRLEAQGNHEIKVGLDVESNFRNSKRVLSGDMRFTNRQDLGNVEVFRYVALAPQGDDSSEFGDICGRGMGIMGNSQVVACDYTPSGDVEGRTLNFASYLQDSWQILPHLTLNVGLRYEEQRLRNAEHLQGTISPHDGTKFETNAMTLRNMWAPRVGIIYDWTKEGRSKVYANWGRYYESIPMDINDRSFGGEGWMTSSYDTSNKEQCGEIDKSIGSPSGPGCIATGATPSEGDTLNGAGVLVAPGLKAQYLDETILGVEYELIDNLKFGLALQNRTLGRVLEDLSTDNAKTYILANPGSWPEEEERALEAKISKTTDVTELNRLKNQLQQFRGIRNFDAPRRDYNSATLSLTKSFSNNFFVQSSYVYSRTEGNYQGLFSSQNGQIDPNITSLFDLPELMANRDGPLPQDRPHFFKIDGAYIFDLEKAGEIKVGTSFRALSGTPINVLSSHYRYGSNETMLLKRGSMGRIDFNVNASVKLSYKIELSKGMQFEGWVDIFNLNAFDFLLGQGTASVDETYTFSNTNPVVGGKYEDLVYLKGLSQGTGAETGVPVSRNLNYGKERGIYRAPSAQFGARLRF